MSTTTESSTTPTTLVPPEESLWKRYSPHHEAPLSGITSVALHLLALGAIAMIALIDTKCNDPDALDLEKRSANGDNVKVLPIVPVIVKDGGGGGNPNGKDRKPGGDPVEKDKTELGTTDKKDTPRVDTPPIDHPVLSATQQQGLKVSYDNDPNVVRLIKHGTEAFDALSKLEQQTRQALRKSVNPGAGQGGVGRDGGRDSGKDTGVGPTEGPGKGQLTQREKRMLRWAMTFNTQDGQDYRRQLQGLGAILAFPVRGESSRFLLVHNLNDPESAKIEDISSLNRIFWVDDKPSSVRSLCAAIRMQPPEYFAAFFPKELEERLLDVEMAYMQTKYGKRNEDLIHETRFDVVNNGGKYDVKVSNMSMNR